MQLRKMTASDIPAGMRLKELAGWNQTPADWERFLHASPEGCFVAELDGTVRGTVTTIIYEDRFAWVGMVLVDPEFRSKGIGTQLLEHAVRYLDTRGVPTVKLDATPQGKPLYEKLGFLTEYEVERWVLKSDAISGSGTEPRRATSGRQDYGPGEASPPTEASVPKEAAQPETPDDNAILELDREIFGADRGALLRSIGEQSPGFSLIEFAAPGTTDALPFRPAGNFSGPQAIAGYAFGRHGTRADHLGPWIAAGEASARSLLDSFLERSRHAQVFVDCLKSSPFACRLLHEHGFKFSRPLTRMYRGANTYPGRPEYVCAVVGPEFG